MAHKHIEQSVKECQRFSIRKLSIGAASVLLATVAFMSTGVSSQVHAAETSEAATTQASSDAKLSDAKTKLQAALDSAKALKVTDEQKKQAGLDKAITEAEAAVKGSDINVVNTKLDELNKAVDVVKAEMAKATTTKADTSTAKADKETSTSSSTSTSASESKTSASESTSSSAAKATSDKSKESSSTEAKDEKSSESEEYPGPDDLPKGYHFMAVFVKDKDSGQFVFYSNSSDWSTKEEIALKDFGTEPGMIYGINYLKTYLNYLGYNLDDSPENKHVLETSIFGKTDSAELTASKMSSDELKNKKLITVKFVDENDKTPITKPLKIYVDKDAKSISGSVVDVINEHYLLPMFLTAQDEGLKIPISTHMPISNESNRTGGKGAAISADGVVTLHQSGGMVVEKKDHKKTEAKENQPEKPKKISKEESFAGIAYVPEFAFNPFWKLPLVDGEGNYTGKNIATNSNWKILAKKTIDGEVYYRLGTDKQWISADYVTVKSADQAKTETPAKTETKETPAKEAASQTKDSKEVAYTGVVYAPVINNNRGWKIALLDGEGNYTGQFISTDSNWKIFAKKTMNGEDYYRLGTDKQWVPAKFVTVKSAQPVKTETPAKTETKETPAKETATQTKDSKEEAVSGVAYAPVINNNAGWMIALLDGEGNYTGKYIPTNSNWKVLAKKTVNGEDYYRLGTDKQWVPGKFLEVKLTESAKSTTPTKTESKETPATQTTAAKEEAVSGVAYAPVINNNPGWMIALLDGEGNYTGKYIPTNSNWKVYAKKTINGTTYYRLGTDKQWVPERFLQFKASETAKTVAPTKSETPSSTEEAISGIAHAPVINNNPGWMIALLDGEGNYTGKYISTNSNWKVFARKTINGRTYYRLGTDQQWAPASYLNLIK